MVHAESSVTQEPAPREPKSARRSAERGAACVTCELHAEAVFRVEGMDCSEEVVILERRLKPLDGLEALAADVIGQRLHVKYDAAKLTTDAMVDAVGQTGMRMWLEHDEPLTSDAGVRSRAGPDGADAGRAVTGQGRAGKCDLSMTIGVGSLEPPPFTARSLIR